MKTISFLSLLFLLTACSSPSSPPIDAAPASASPASDTLAKPVAGKTDTAIFPLQKATILHDEGAVNFRLPYTRLISDDTSRHYLVLATYKGEKVGFEIMMSSKGLALAKLITIGQPSDNFLRLLQTVYHQEVDKASYFADTVKVDCLSMGDYVDSLRKNMKGDYVATQQYKLFFESNNPDWEAECYLNINASDHWIELDEKDPEYPPKMIRDMSRQAPR